MKEFWMLTTYLFEYNLLALFRSCDGEPAPDRTLPAILPDEFSAPGSPNGDLKAPPLAGSIGDVLVVDDPDRGKLPTPCGR